MASTSASGNRRKAACIDAFDEFAPSASSSSSASTPMKRPSFDVFINHRGPDVKSTIATTLYDMLTQRHLSVFLDKPELEYGDFIPDTLKAAMRSALVHIAIFSEGYAESRWCLEELSFMVKSGAPIIPIFYHVDPYDLRWAHQGKGKYVDAFEGYLRKNRYLGKLNEWKKALWKASFYKGEFIQNKDDEDSKLKNIVDTVLKMVKRESLCVADYPVGMEEIVEDFEKNTIHSKEADGGVKIIGIWGMGGSGKTTLAKELYNKKSSMFQWSSFVSNVRDASNKGLLYERQRKIFKDLNLDDMGFFNIEEGKETLSRQLRSVKVFLVLDDVDHVDQLDALMPVKHRLESGSLILVTTRDCDVLRFWRVTSIYNMRALDPVYAKQLFTLHAFEQPLHQDGFEELVEKFLKACNGLPLSLKVIGRQLKGKSDKEFWESLLYKVITVVPNDIQKILKISYDNLDDQEKEMFLDVACFFIGEESSLVIEIWNGLGWSGQQGLNSLLNKCLVEFVGVKINMHDHIRDLGRSIATSQSPYRFGHSQTIINVQNQIEKTIGIHGIIVTGDEVHWELWGLGILDPTMARVINGRVDEFHVRFSEGGIEVDTNCGIWSLSPSSVGLKYLVISGDSFSEVSRDLVWLRWFNIGQPNLPTGLLMKNLRVLEVFEEKYGEGHLEKLWVDSEVSRVCFESIFRLFYNCPMLYVPPLANMLQVPVQLRHLLLYDCTKFQGFPKSIGRLTHLKKIEITDTSSVTSLPDEFCFLKSLEHLTLSMSGLQSLPINFGNLSNLRHLDLSFSSVLRTLPASFKNLSLLQHLNLAYCRKLTLKSEEELNCLQNVTKLEYLNLEGCERLEELPRHIANNVFLTELRLRCPLRELPENIGQLSKLRQMSIYHALLTSLPTSLRWLSSLTELCISHCPELKCFPDSLGGLSSLTKLDISYCPELDRVGEKSVAKAIRQLSNLQRLSVVKCPISGSSLSFGSSNLQSLLVDGTKVCKISCSTHLEKLSVYANCHLEEIEALPMTLESIYLKDCKVLKRIASLARSTSLRIFSLVGRNRIVKIEGIENCIGLEKLIIESRTEVRGIESLEHLRNLRQLKLTANKGAVIKRCIQRMQEWPSETTIICARAVPDAASLLQSLLPSNVEIVDSISNQNIESSLKLIQRRISTGGALMLCFVINCVSSQATFCIPNIWSRITEVEKGRWAWVGVYTPRSSSSRHEEYYIHFGGGSPFYGDEEYSIHFGGGSSFYRHEEYSDDGGECGGEDEVERGVAIVAEEGTLMEAFQRLWPLFIQS